tara:strand:- start:355 stop:1101 length:747 start_codon:yes stop_codon:yes gene_type:complete
MRYKKVGCYVGHNLSYSMRFLKVILDKNIEIEFIAGEKSNLIYPIIEKLIKNKPSLFSEKKPWLNNQFSKILKKDILGINCGFGYIIPKKIINLHDIINMHPSALPFNRGCHHSFWGIMESTPLGATLHFMDTGLDTGPIIQKKTFLDDGEMNANEIQNISNQYCVDLLNENLIKIMKGDFSMTPQGKGTYHSKSEIITESTLSYSDKINISKLFDICRATNNKNNGFIVDKFGEKFKIIISSIEKIN